MNHGKNYAANVCGVRLRAAALSIWFFVLFLLSFSWRVLGCGERSEPHLSMTSTRHGAII